jgi:hypothetical protein
VGDVLYRIVRNSYYLGFQEVCSGSLQQLTLDAELLALVSLLLLSVEERRKDELEARLSE